MFKVVWHSETLSQMNDHIQQWEWLLNNEDDTESNFVWRVKEFWMEWNSPFDTLVYENRAIYKIELVNPLRVVSRNFQEEWRVGSKFTKTLIAELIET